MSEYHFKKRVPFHQRPKPKAKIPPALPKPCYVYYNGIGMNWDKAKKMLVFTPNTIYLFASRRLAHDAIWKTCEQSTSGLPPIQLFKQYEIVEA